MQPPKSERNRKLGKYGVRARLPNGNNNPAYYRAKRKEFKRLVIDHYSNGTMACADPFHKHLPNDPFLADIRDLQIDHINGGGNKERKSHKGSTLFAWLIRHNYPEGYQVLCANCNWVKRCVNGEAE
jgi:hypothetical protein